MAIADQAQPITVAAANVDIKAAADVSKPARIAIKAYGGGIVRPLGMGSHVVDLAGITLPNQVPLLLDHQNNVDSVAGTGTPQIKAGVLSVEGTLARGVQAAEKVLALSSSGVQLSASIGVEIGEREFIRENETVHVNGQTITAPGGGMILVTKGHLREVSLLAIGADATAAVSISAKGNAGMSANIQTSQHSNDVETIQTAWAQTEWHDKDSPIYLRAQDAMVKAAAGQMSEAQFFNVLKQEKQRDDELNQVRKNRTSSDSFTIQSNTRPGRTRDAIEAAFLIRAGRESLAESNYGPQVMEATSSLRNRSFVDLCQVCCELDGRETGGMNRNEMLRAAFSTISLPTALSNVAGKSLLESYRESTASWRGFAQVLPAANFKPQTGVRPSFVGNLEQLPKGGEIQHGSLAESTYSWYISTFAKMLTVDRQDIINDDLGFITQTAPLMGKAAARSLNDLVWSTIMANAGAFFSSGNANLLEAGSAMDLESLGLAVATMRKQTDGNDNDIDIAPRVVAVPPELEVLTRSILNSEEVSRPSDENSPTGNALRNIAEPVVESRLSNTAKFANASATAWYLFAGPADAAVVVGFLDGQQSPTIEFFGLDTDPNTLAVSWRVYHDYGVALGDHRAAVKATGAS